MVGYLEFQAKEKDEKGHQQILSVPQGISGYDDEIQVSNLFT